MKRIINYIPASILSSIAAFISCSVNEIDSEIPISEEERQEIAIIAEHINDNEFKTVRNTDGTVSWKPSESINVFFKSNGSKFTSTNTENASKASFSGSLTISSVIGINEGTEDDNCLWGLYPYNENASCDGYSVTTTLSAEQTGVAGTFADNLYITLAKSKSFVLGFYNVLTGFKFTVSQTGIKSITFSGNNGEVLAGKVKLSFEDGKPYVADISEGSTSITLTPENGEFEVGKYYYFVFVPTTFDKGFEVSMSKDSSEGTFTYSREVNFDRNIFVKKDNIDDGVEFSAKLEAVDLGLSVKWGTINIGAKTLEDIGYSYCWGEISNKVLSKWNNYKYADYHNNNSDNVPPDFYVGSMNQTRLNKYCTNGKYGKVDNRIILDEDDDVATKMYGENWRMPTIEEWRELFSNSKTTDYSEAGIPGIVFTSTKTGYKDKSIFIPVGKNTNIYYNYWTSSLKVDSPYNAMCAYFSSTGYTQSYGAISRSELGYIRPVFDDQHSKITGISLNASSITLKETETTSLKATVEYENGAINNGHIEWISENPEVAFVDNNGNVNAISAGSTKITVYTAHHKFSANCVVTVDKVFSEPHTVDLGLSVLWANENIGAESPECSGKYFSYGEILPKSVYQWESYKWMDFSNLSVSKYYNGDIIDKEDDISYVELGSGWKTPSVDEWNELINTSNCNWSWTMNYMGTGVKGYIITSKKEGYTNNSIFLPAAGQRREIQYDYNSAGYYWSGSTSWSHADNGRCMVFSSSNRNSYPDGNYKFIGMSIRPVKIKE